MNLLPPLSTLRAFEHAARLGSFAAAARALNVTPPAVAQQVRALEQDLGQPLFRRLGRGQVLTESGAELAEGLGQGFAALARAVARARETLDRRGLRISATPAFSHGSLLPRLERFWARHPEVAVSILPNARIVDLEREGFDLAVRSGPGAWPGVVAERLINSRVTLVAAPGLLQTGKPLADLPWIADMHFAHEAPYLRAAGLDPAALHLRHVEDMAMTVDAARAGHGLLFATQEVTAADLAAGRLIEVPFPGLPETSYWIVTPPGPRRPVVDQFIAWLRAEFGA